MSDPSALLQRAVAGALLAAGPVAALVGDRVRDEVDGTGALPSPYIELGPIQVIDDSTQCSAGKTLIETLNVFATGPKAKLVAMAVSDAASAVFPAIALTGYVVHPEPLVEALHRADPDGQSAHSIITVTWQVSPV